MCCLVQSKLSPGEEGYQVWEGHEEVWSPNKIPGYLQSKNHQSLGEKAEEKDTPSHKIEKTRKINTIYGLEEELNIENVVLNHSFDR